MYVLKGMLDLNLSASDNFAIIFKDEIFALLLTRQLVEAKDYDLFVDIAQNLIDKHLSIF